MLGRASLHTLDHAQGARIWFAAEATDMRCDAQRGQDEIGAHVGVCRGRSPCV